MNARILTTLPEVLSATATVHRLRQDLAATDEKINEIYERMHAAAPERVNDLDRAMHLLAGTPTTQDSTALTELQDRRRAVSAGLTVAEVNLTRVTKEASSVYWCDMVPTLVAEIQAVCDGLQVAIDAAKRIADMRIRGEQLGFDSDAGSWPLRVDSQLVDLPGLRKELLNLAEETADRASTKAEPDVSVRALLDLPSGGLKAGEIGKLPAKQARQMVRSGWAEFATNSDRLRKLVGA